LAYIKQITIPKRNVTVITHSLPCLS